MSTFVYLRVPCGSSRPLDAHVLFIYTFIIPKVYYIEVNNSVESIPFGLCFFYLVPHSLYILFLFCFYFIFSIVRVTETKYIFHTLNTVFFGSEGG